MSLDPVMPQPLERLRDLAQLGNELSLVYLLVDALNSECARRAAAGKLPEDSHNLLNYVWDHLPDNIGDLARRSELGGLFQECGIVPSLDPSVQDRVRKVLLDSGRPAFTSERGEPTVRRHGVLPPIPTPEKLTKTIFLLPGFDGHEGFVSHDDSGREAPVSRRRNTPVMLLDEFFDPLGAVRGYLVNSYGLKETVIGHYIQQWLVHQFRIPSHPDFRFALASVCDRLHTLFYGVARPSRLEFRSRRGATVGASFFIYEIARCLLDPNPASQLPKTRSDALPVAVGIYMFLRLRRLLRFRYHLLAADILKEARVEPVTLVPTALQAEEPASKPQRSSAAQLVQTAHRRQCVDLLRPLEYSFLKTAIFGVQSSIDGLNFIFRGGILQREGVGRTIMVNGSPGVGKTLFALQFLTDLAAKGWLSIYFSVEEDYDSILSRLVTFDFVRHADFDILTADKIPDDEATLGGSARKGLLLLYQMAPGKRVSIPEVLGQLAKRSGFRNRAVAIDSINALNFRRRSQAEGHEVRSAVQELVEAIDDRGFIGLILSEQDDVRLSVAPYLVDTVISLQVGAGGEGRTLEIRKCRSQNFQKGPHSLHFSERKGIIIHPSLEAFRSTLRTRVRATLSERRKVNLPPEMGKLLDLPYVREKASVMITGEPGSGKTLLGLQLLTEPSRPTGEDERRAIYPSNVLVVTFRTPELQFLQILRQHNAILARWRRIRAKMVRWYSPGSSITGAQILAETRRFITRARRFGLPLERILFDGAEVSELMLPALKREPLFWPTMFELVNTEAITSIFVVGDQTEIHPSVSVLGAEVDYAFRLSRQRDMGTAAADGQNVGRAPSLTEEVGHGIGERTGNRVASVPLQRGYVELVRVPHLAPLKIGEKVPFSFDQNTRLVL